MGWLDRLKGKAAAPALADLIGDYPPYSPPFERPHGKLKAEEAQVNFDHLMQAKPDRLARLHDLLCRFGLETGDAVEATDPTPFLDRLHAWTADQWPSLQNAQTLHEASWTFDGPARGATLAMVGDVGLLLGEMIVRRRADFAWRLDLDPADRPMASYRRACVIRDAGTEGRCPSVADPVDWAYVSFRNCAGPSYRQFSPIGRGVLDYLADGPAGPPASVPPPPLAKGRGGYDNAYDHVDGVREAGGSPDDAAACIGVFAAWAVLHGLTTPALAARAVHQIEALTHRETTPGRFVYAALDGKFRPDDLSAIGGRFADAYYRSGGDTKASRYLQDIETAFPGFDQDGFIPDAWASYDRLAPILDQRFARWRASGET